MKRHYLFLLVIGCGVLVGDARANEYEDTTLVNAGDKAPDFECQTIDGEKFSLEACKGKVVFINFFATWCGPCRSELPHLEKSIFERFKAEGDFKLIVIGREHTTSELKEFRDKEKLALPFAPDPKRGIYGKYATKYIPRNVIIGRDGVVRFAEVGFDQGGLKRMAEVVESELGKPAPSSGGSPEQPTYESTPSLPKGG